MKRKVLIVQDDPAVLEQQIQVVRHLGCETLVARDGIRGWETAKRERPDAILLDVSAPVCGGASLLRRLKGEPSTQAIPVAVITDRLGECDFGSGALMALSKPFTTRALQVVLLNLLTQPKRAAKPALGRAA